jgi:hypothetical protein
VLSLASYVVCPVVPAIVALVLASSAKQEIAMSGGRQTGDGLIKAAVILSWVNIGLTVAVIVGLVALVAIGTSTTTTY